jgi:hypothetical protein
METKQTYFATISMTALLGVALLVGCHHDAPEVSSRGQDFYPPGVPTSMDRISAVQATKGAAADAMLYDQHFDGPALNALGRHKIDAIMRGTSVNKPLVVYLDMPHDTAQSRQAAVADYIKNAGVQDSAVQIVLGPNPNLTTPAAYNLTEIYKVNGDNITGEAADATAAAPAAPVSASGSSGGSSR